MRNRKNLAEFIFAKIAHWLNEHSYKKAELIKPESLDELREMILKSLDPAKTTFDYIGCADEIKIKVYDVINNNKESTSKLVKKISEMILEYSELALQHVFDMSDEEYAKVQANISEIVNKDTSRYVVDPSKLDIENYDKSPQMGALIKEDNWQHRAANIRCKTCMWFVPKIPKANISEHIGRCRHDAPTLKGWPVMFRTDWCGSHKLDETKL